MNQTIKTRIEQIGRGEVPEGYKKTKVGVIPQEWEMTRLSKYLRVNNDKNNALKYSKEDVFSVSGELGIVNQIELLGRSYAGVSVAPYGIVYPNNIVYTKSPLKANPYGIIKANKTGKTGIVSTLYAIYHCRDNTNSSFVEHYFGLDLTLNNYLYPIVNIGAKHDMKISDENALKGYVVFPSLAEQEKIAEILDTQDKLIALKEKRIAEKKQQKKYLMQQLLTGKKRLPGFTGKWREYPISQFLEIRNERQLPTVEAPLRAFVAEKGIIEKGSRYDRSFLVKSDDKEYKRTELWDFIYSSNNLDVGSIGLNTYGSAVISIVYEIFKVKSTTLPILISDIIQLTENMHN
jgi:type I restriction enzyme S subunit